MLNGQVVQQKNGHAHRKFQIRCQASEVCVVYSQALRVRDVVVNGVESYHCNFVVLSERADTCVVRWLRWSCGTP